MTGDGEYWIGLCGGVLYGVAEIGEVFNAARFDYAKARIGGKGHPEAIPAWYLEHPKLKEYVESADATDYDPDPSEYTDAPTEAEVQEYADVLAGEGSAELLRGALSTWLEDLGIGIVETLWESDIPMMSSVYEDWWCESPEDAAAKLTDRLRQILDRRAAG